MLIKKIKKTPKGVFFIFSFNILSFYVVFREHPDKFSDDGYEEPPVPIPNTVVKLVNAESTWLETAWEDRKSLIKKIKKTPKGVFFIFSFNILFWSGRFQPD